MLTRAEAAESPFFTVNKDPSRAGLGPSTSLIERRTAERLMVLESIGLAESTGPKTWRVRRDFVNVLRAMQRSADRQKTLAAHGALISDERLQMTVLDASKSLRPWKAESWSTERKSPPDAATSYSKERTRESTMSTTLRKSKRPEIAGACGRILSFSFESRLRRAVRRSK